MARLHVDESTAFDVLRQRSQHTNIKVHDVARAVIAEISPDEPT
jgi:AmiR/NasT family two-component response regulator